MSIASFPIAIPQATMDDRRDRLAHTRWPDELEGGGWDYGTNGAYLQEWVDYWQHHFDWRPENNAQSGRAGDVPHPWDCSPPPVTPGHSPSFVSRPSDTVSPPALVQDLL